ncbi:hypothetical protein ACW9HQ_41495 [Nocardia gipuzkoensis]
MVGEITEVFVFNHTYAVRFDDAWSVLFWTGDAPAVGTQASAAPTDRSGIEKPRPRTHP